MVSALASKLAQQKAPVRLAMVEAGSALDAANTFSSGKVDLAVVRGDVGDLSKARKWVGIYLEHPHAPDADAEQAYQRLMNLVR